MLTWRALPRPMRSTAVFVRLGLEPMARGFIYLAAVLDWFTRRVLAWRIAARQLVTVLPPIPGSRVRDHQEPPEAEACGGENPRKHLAEATT